MLLLGTTGCDEGPRIVGAQREWEEQADRAKEYAKERTAAHRGAVRIQHEMRPRLRPARRPSADCKVEYAPMRPRGGIEPIACGNLAGVWPLTTKQGYLRCEPSVVTGFHRVIFIALNGSEYVVNTDARDPGQLGIDAIMRRRKGAKRVDLKPLSERGLSLCREAQ